MHVYEPIEINNITPEQFIIEMFRRRNLDLEGAASGIKDIREKYKQGELTELSAKRRETSRIRDLSGNIWKGMRNSRNYFTSEEVCKITRGVIDSMIEYGKV